MRRGRLAIHAHFYQPERRDPFGGPVPRDPAAAPYSTWTERIIAECYRPNEQLGNLERISYNVGPTLTAALAADDPAMLARIANAHGENALAQGFHHSILPLAGPRDRRTEVRWGLRDHEVRFGRAATGFWLPETAADKLTLRILAEEGVRYTILAPWQAAMPGIEVRRPHRVDLGGGLSLVVVFFDAELSGAASFRPEVTADADRFAREWVVPRVTAPLRPDGRLSRPDESPLVVLATDGELYGHHQPFRDLFLQRLVDPAIDRGFDVVTLGEALADLDDRSLPTVRPAERTSWSCHHGLLRWSEQCPCTPDTRWKQPLRAALERLAGAIDAVAELRLAGLDPWAARDAYVDVLVGLVTGDAFSARWLGPNAPPARRQELEVLMEAQRWRLAMFASDGWFWEDPARPETRQVLRSAARAARLVDDLVGSRLERRLVEDLAALASPTRGADGAAIYREALAEVGQDPV
jgi:hypothetical protein